MGQEADAPEQHPSLWTPPSVGTLKLNFDGGCVGGVGWGWGFVLRDSSGDVVMAGVQQGSGFAGPEVEEARACVFDIKNVIARGFTNLVIEGDCLALI